MQRVTPRKIQEIADKIAKEYKPEKIILFGSYAWGKTHEWSDVDLFIVKNDKKNPLEMIREVNRIIFKREIPVDILVYTSSQVDKRKKLKDPFLIKIIELGKVLYEK